MRSELQEAEDPKCTGHESGLHCGHMDTHDSCCDCNWHTNADGDWCNCAGGLAFHLTDEAVSAWKAANP